ncbi:hypothetical protein ACJX0J_019667 [Zea mays]
MIIIPDNSGILGLKSSIQSITALAIQQEGSSGLNLRCLLCVISFLFVIRRWIHIKNGRLDIHFYPISPRNIIKTCKTQLTISMYWQFLKKTATRNNRFPHLVFLTNRIRTTNKIIIVQEGDTMLNCYITKPSANKISEVILIFLHTSMLGLVTSSNLMQIYFFGNLLLEF